VKATWLILPGVIRSSQRLSHVWLVCTLSVGVLLHTTWCVVRSLGEVSPGDVTRIVFVSYQKDLEPSNCETPNSMKTADRPVTEGRLKVVVVTCPLVGNGAANSFNVLYRRGDQQRRDG
jgi:hypothetical protein